MTLPDTPPETTLPAVDDSVVVATLPDGELLVYDQDQPTAWLRTDTAVSLDDRA